MSNESFTPQPKSVVDKINKEEIIDKVQNDSECLLRFRGTSPSSVRTFGTKVEEVNAQSYKTCQKESSFESKKGI